MEIRLISSARLVAIAALFAPVLVAQVATSGSATARQGVPMCHGHPATIVGTAGNDVIHGTPGDDVIVALKGRDTVHAGAGDDIVCGGKGGDRLFGGTGRDELFGQRGGAVSDDENSGYFLGNLIDGGPGDDLLSGGPQGDKSFQYDGGAVPDRVTFRSATGPITVDADGVATGPGIGTDKLRADFGLINGTPWGDILNGVGAADINGRGGDDTIVATAPKAWLDYTGGPGDDTFDMTATRRAEEFGGRGRDRITGSPGLDYVRSGPGADIVDTGKGRDDVDGAGAGDVVRLGPGDDKFTMANKAGDFTVDGGAGHDRLAFKPNAKSRVLIDAGGGWIRSRGVRSRISSFETFVYDAIWKRFRTGSFVFRGSSSDEYVIARAGVYDKLIVQGAGGNDVVVVQVGPGSAHAHVYGGPGDDTITGSDYADHLDGNAGDDTIDGRGGIDTCIGEHLTNCER